MEGPPPDAPKFPCKVCGRNFVEQSLVKHETACLKLQNKKRKVFDAGKMRAQGSDIPITSVRKLQKEISQVKGTFKQPKSNWREQHENFVGAIRSSRDVDVAMKTGSPLPPPPRSAVPSNYVKCEYCNRNFNHKAAERHVPFCKEQALRKDSSQTSTTTGSRGRGIDGATNLKPRTTAPRSKSIGRMSKENTRVIEHSTNNNSKQTESQHRRRFVSTSPPPQRNGSTGTRAPPNRNNATRSMNRSAEYDFDYSRKSTRDQSNTNGSHSDDDNSEEESEYRMAKGGKPMANRGGSGGEQHRRHRAQPQRSSNISYQRENDADSWADEKYNSTNPDGGDSGQDYWRKQSSIDDDEYLTRRQMGGPRPRQTKATTASRIPQPGRSTNGHGVRTRNISQERAKGGNRIRY